MRRLRSILVCTLLVVLVACATAPTGRRQMALLSPAELDAQGARAFDQMRQEKPLMQDAAVQRYVRCVTDHLLVAAGSSPARWDVVVFRDDAANAFAMPGGHIGVFSGMLRVARNQDQLAAVIGHEIAHVLANHTNERLSQQIAVQGGLGVLDTLAGGTAGQPATTTRIAGVGLQLGLLLPYNRVQEQEADRIGLELMARAGFDPGASLELWRNMAAAGGATPPEFLSTHPAHGRRIQDLEARMPQAMETFGQARSQGRVPDCG